jgi:hypothetical protein
MASHSLSFQTIPPCSSNAYLEVSFLMKTDYFLYLLLYSLVQVQLYIRFLFCWPNDLAPSLSFLLFSCTNTQVAKLAREKFKEEISLKVKDQDISIAKVQFSHQSPMLWSLVLTPQAFVNMRRNTF